MDDLQVRPMDAPDLAVLGRYLVLCSILGIRTDDLATKGSIVTLDDDDTVSWPVITLHGLSTLAACLGYLGNIRMPQA